MKIDTEALRGLVAPFLDKTAEDNSDDHWMWTGEKRKHIGIVKTKTMGTQGAARVLLMLHHPNWDWENIMVKRTCDTRFCVKPSHHEIVRTGYRLPAPWPENSKVAVTKEYNAR